jgi:hypothetical protein
MRTGSLYPSSRLPRASAKKIMGDRFYLREALHEFADIVLLIPIIVTPPSKFLEVLTGLDEEVFQPANFSLPGEKHAA